MRTGLNARGIFYYLLSLFVATVCLSQEIQVTNLNENRIMSTPYKFLGPYIDQDLMQHEVLGVQIDAYYVNYSADTDYEISLEIDKYSKIPLPDYVEGWVDKFDTLAPGEEKTLQNIIYIHPVSYLSVKLDSFIIQSSIRYGLIPTNRMISRFAKIRINVIQKDIMYNLPILEEESAFTRGTTNSISWLSPEGNISEDAYCYDVENPVNRINSVRGLYRTSQTENTQQAYFEGLEDGHRYGYYVKSLQNTPRGEIYLHSNTQYSIQDNTPPHLVIHPQALIRIDSTVLVSWGAVTDEVSGVSSYRIYRGVDTSVEEFIGEKTYTGLDSYTWIDTAPITGNTNYYRVRAVDWVGNEGEGERSNGIDISGDNNYIPPGDPVDNDTISTDYVSYHKGSVDTLWIELEVGDEVDSLRFEAVRDSLKFFDSPPAVGSRYFDSGWLAVDSLKNNPNHPNSVFYIFDYSKNDTVDIDKNFIDGHTYFRRVTKKYSFITDAIWLGEIISDCLPPEDTYNTKTVAVMDDVDFQDPLSGYTQWHIELSWQPVVDDVSGLKRYHVYRKIEGKDSNFSELILPEDFRKTFLKDTLSDSEFGQLNNPLVAYRIVGEDQVGNQRSFDDTDWEVRERALGPPCLTIGDTDPAIIYPSNSAEEDTVFTNQDYIRFRIQNFDVSEIVNYAVFVNGVERTEHSFIQDMLTVQLPDTEVSEIQVRALYDGKRSSTWSSKKYTVRTQNQPPPILMAWNDTTGWNGHNYLKWVKPSLDAISYEVWRWNEAGDSSLIGIVPTPNDTIRWIDYYGLSELSGEADDVLTNYELYQYRVRKVNMFGEKTDFSNADAVYCNHPPIIVSDKIKKSNGDEVIVIHWLRVQPTIASGSWLTRVRVYRDRLDNMIYQTNDITSVVDDTTYMYDIDVQLGHNYIFQIKEIPEFPAGRVSGWSKPYTVNLASLDSLFIQPQPEGHIFLSWEEDTLIDRLPVDSFEICRMTIGDTLFFTLPNTQTSYMDPSYQLIHGQSYCYRVSALNNLGQILATNTREVICDTGKVFIPAVDIFNLLYFNSDSLEVFWHWNDINKDPLEGTTRGADSLYIQISVSQSFTSGSGMTVTTNWLKADPFDRSRKIEIPAAVNEDNNTIYCRITAKDRWAHPQPAIYSKIESVVFDPDSPNQVYNFTIDSVTSYNKKPDRVYAHLQWTGEGVEWPENDGVFWTKTIGNIAKYRIVRVSSSNDTVEAGYTPVHTGIDGVDQDHVYTFSDNVPNRVHHWGITSIDSAGNEAVTVWVEPDSFLATPVPPTPVDFDSCFCQSVENNTDMIEYFFEIAMDSTHFQLAYDSSFFELTDHLLSQSGWIQDTIYKDETGWGSIETDTTWFRMKIRRNMNWESGWSILNYYTKGNGEIAPKTIVDELGGVPTTFKVYQNVPNPFNAGTVFTYQLPSTGDVTIRIYNIRGSLVRTLFSDNQSEGFYSVIWDGKDNWGRSSASGIYFLHVLVETGRGEILQERMKMMMIK